MTKLNSLGLMILACLTDSIVASRNLIEEPITSQLYEDFYEYNDTRFYLATIPVRQLIQLQRTHNLSLDDCIQRCRDEVLRCQSVMWTDGKHQVRWTNPINHFLRMIPGKPQCFILSIRGNYHGIIPSRHISSYVKKPLLFVEFPLVYENFYCDYHTESWNVTDLIECGRICHQYTDITKGRGICNAFNYLPNTRFFWPNYTTGDIRLNPQCNLQTELICNTSILRHNHSTYYARDTSRPIPPRSFYSLTVTSDGDSLLVSGDEGRIFSGFQLYEEREVSCKIGRQNHILNQTLIKTYFNSRAQCIDLCRYDKKCGFITYGGNMTNGKNCLTWEKQYCPYPSNFTIANITKLSTRAVDSYQKLDVEMDNYDIYPQEYCNVTFLTNSIVSRPLDVFECEAMCAKHAGCGAFTFERGDCLLRTAHCSKNMTDMLTFIANVYRTGLLSSLPAVYVRKPGRTARLGDSNLKKFFNQYKKRSCLAAGETTTSNETTLEKCLYSAILASSNMVHFVANLPHPCFLHTTTCNYTARYREEQTTVFIKTQYASQINKFELHVNTECKYRPAFLQDLNTFDAMACGRRCYADPKCKSFFFFPFYPAAESKKYPKFTGNCELKASVCRPARRIYGVYNYYIKTVQEDNPYWKKNRKNK